MNQRHVGMLLLVAACLFAGARPAMADKIYLINNYPGEQNDSTLSGHITVTDAAVNDGLLTAAEIVSWAFTATNAGATITTTVDSTTAPNPDIALGGPVQITATEILLPEPGQPNTNFLFLGDSLSGAQNGLLRWDRNRLFNPIDIYSASDNQGTGAPGDDVTYWNKTTSPSTLGGADPWVIATAVPEPGSLALLSLGALGLLRFRRRKV